MNRSSRKIAHSTRQPCDARPAVRFSIARAAFEVLCFLALASTARAQIDWHVLDPWRGWKPPPEERRVPGGGDNNRRWTPPSPPVKSADQIAKENALQKLDEANSALTRGDLRGAIELLTTAARWTPNDPSILRLLQDARVQLAAKERAEAEARRQKKINDAVVETLPVLITTLQIAAQPGASEDGARAPGFPADEAGGAPPGFPADPSTATRPVNTLPPGFRGPDSIVVPPPASPSAYSCPVALFDVTGKFEIIRKDGRRYQSSELAVIPLDGGTRVLTSAGARVHLLLPDETVFTIGPDSDMILDDFVYDSKTGVRTISANLAKGAFRWITGKVAPHDPRNMNLRLRIGMVGIRGTDFLTAVRPDGTTYLWLFEGEVEFAANATGQRVTLHPAQMLKIGADGVCAPVETFAP